MRRPPRPKKHENVTGRIRDLAAQGKYLETRHAAQRMRERQITRMEVQYVLKTGRHEPRKDQFSEDFKEWAYAIRGYVLDRDKELRIAAVINEEHVLVITAIHLDA